jgi:hypothetical protein
MSVRSKFVRLLLCSPVALTGCGSNIAAGGPASQPVPSLSSYRDPRRSPPGSENVSARAQHPRGASRMHRGMASEDLLYVTNVYTVNVYTYPRGKLKATLSGFSEPAGECVDRNQDVFITNFNSDQVFEYAHGGKNPIATLKSPSAGPAGCSIDPTTGNLAVSSLGFGSTGSVGIYKHARGNPVIYRDALFQEYFYCGYDASGNLFVDGQNANAVFEFAELAKHATQLKTITLNETIGFPGGVQWDGKYMVVGDQNTPVVYRFAISGDTGQVVGSTTLGGSDVTDISQFFITGGRLIAPNQCKGSCAGNVLYYNYPAGGNSTKTISNGVRYPHGAVVSKG